MPSTKPVPVVDERDNCPVGCGRIRSKNHLMCRACWGLVEPAAQDAVYETWGAWRRNRADANLMRAYTHAARAAVDAVKAIREARKR